MNKTAGADHTTQSGRPLSDCAALFTREGIEAVSSERVPTGFPALDRGLSGGLTNGLYVLGAVPGLGKSTLALQIAYNLSSQGIPVLYFALMRLLREDRSDLPALTRPLCLWGLGVNLAGTVALMNHWI